MQWLNALSTCPSLEAAIAEVVATIKSSLQGKPDLGVIFISSAYTSDYPRLLPLLLERLPLEYVIGCGGSGIVGTNASGMALEIEDNNPALSLSVACLPGVDIHPFHVLGEMLPDLDSPPQFWLDLVGVAPTKQPQFILLADPVSARINDLLAGLDFAYPGMVKVGGLSSAGMMGIPSGLFCYSPKLPKPGLYREGTVGVALSGNIAIETIVAQGCRPIGQPYLVTKGDRNIVLELTDSEGNDQKGRSPLEVLRELIPTLSESDRQLVQDSLFVGMARDEFKLQLGRRDFLVRNVLGVEPKGGAIAIGDRVRPGQRLQFHLRDAQTSAEDLEFLLQAYHQEKGDNPSIKGALMFSCLGRGEGLYGQPNFDSHLFQSYQPHLPLGGFFGNGEIGPVSGSTFLHGYTSVLALMREGHLDS